MNRITSGIYTGKTYEEVRAMQRAAKTIKVEMTLLEAHAVLRALGVANVSERQLKDDIAPSTWVAKRILQEVESNR